MRTADAAPSKLAWKEKIGYALGDTASNFFWKSWEFFLLIFYTDVFGLSPAVAGTMFGVTRVWDAAIDPVMGAIADRTRSRWGRFRPYLLWISLPMAAATVLTYTTPALDTTAKIVYAYVTYTLMTMAYTAVNIPYSALMGVMTSDTQERTALSSLRFIGGFTGGILVVAATPTMVAVLGGGNAARGWQLAMGVWGVLAAVLFYVCFKTTRERVTPPPRQEANLKLELRDLVTNGPWLAMFLLGVITLTSFVMRGQTTAYFFKYYANRPEMTGLFLSSGMIAAIAGMALTAPAIKIFGGKKQLFMGLMTVSGLLTIGFYFVPRDAVWAMIALNLLTCFIQGPNSPLIWAMYADTADYAEWRNGRRNTGLVFAAATMAQKGGGALAGMLSGGLLTAFGYVANAQQSARSLSGIVLMMSVLPGALCILAAATMFIYKLDDRKMKQIERDLLARRAAQGEGSGEGATPRAAQPLTDSDALGVPS
jgi:GPH family glycoside/pentoside/hexuronide:cation symporter